MPPLCHAANGKTIMFATSLGPMQAGDGDYIPGGLREGDATGAGASSVQGAAQGPVAARALSGNPSDWGEDSFGGINAVAVLTRN
jgi:hypothetical protein